MKEDDSKPKPKENTAKSRFGRITFLAKNDESEQELRERFDAKYSDGDEYEYQQSEKFPNGAALVRTKFKEKKNAKPNTDGAKGEDRSSKLDAPPKQSDSGNTKPKLTSGPGDKEVSEEVAEYEQVRDKLDSERLEDEPSVTKSRKKKKK